MTARSFILHAVLGSLACLPGITVATVWVTPMRAFGPEDEVRLARRQRIELEQFACRERPVERRELVVVHRVPEDQSLSAIVRCHEMRDSEGQIPVEVMRCQKRQAESTWQCESHYSNIRVDFGKRYVLADAPPMIIHVEGAPPDNSSDAVAAILASEPRRLDKKECQLPRYVDDAFEIACEGVQYVVKRTCDDKGCRRTVRRK
jgi:hypothetical protein